MPLLTNQYWFFKYYVLLVLLAPFLNQWIAVLDKKQYERMLMTCAVLFSVIPSINVFGDTFGVASGYSLIWFVVLYLTAGYLRKYPLSKGHWLLMYLGCSGAILLTRVCGTVFGGVVDTAAVLQRNYNSPLVFLASIFLFLAALTTPTSFGIKADAGIGRIAGLSFAVYLLHDHGTLSAILWNDWVNLAQCTHDAGVFIARAVCSLAAIFLCGILVEFVRHTIHATINNCFVAKHR